VGKPLPGKEGLTSAERDELARLRRENRQFKMERHIKHMRTELVLGALNMAISTRKPTEVIHHSNQGSQYAALAFGKRCQHMGVRPSMGTVGDAYDNAMAENFFASLECELLDRRAFKTKTEARLAVFTWIEGWYNPCRSHSALGYLLPMTFEEKNQTLAAAP